MSNQYERRKKNTCKLINIHWPIAEKKAWDAVRTAAAVLDLPYTRFIRMAATEAAQDILGRRKKT